MGRFRGPPHFEWLGDGRLMRTLADYAFVDAQDRTWPVPAGAVIDGASIPRGLWSIAGGPFEGSYRNASVIHDWYCDIRTRPWLDVHRMFHEAMLASGVPPGKASRMYFAVYLGGPRWSEACIANTLLATGGRGELSPHRFTKSLIEKNSLKEKWDREQAMRDTAFAEAPLAAEPQKWTDSRLMKIADFAETHRLNPEDIEKIIDSSAPLGF